MAAFGVSFPKLTFCRSAPSKIDPNNVSSTTAPAGSRTLSLSIKNVPSQPIHFDVSTTSSALAKKKTTSIATILAIDGETKQLPRNLSVFNELQFDCGKNGKHLFSHAEQTRISLCMPRSSRHRRAKTTRRKFKRCYCAFIVIPNGEHRSSCRYSIPCQC